MRNESILNKKRNELFIFVHYIKLFVKPAKPQL